VLPVHADAATPEIDGCTTFRRLTVMEDELPRFGTKKPILPDVSPDDPSHGPFNWEILVQYGTGPNKSPTATFSGSLKCVCVCLCVCVAYRSRRTSCARSDEVYTSLSIVCSSLISSKQSIRAVSARWTDEPLDFPQSLDIKPLCTEIGNSRKEGGGVGGKLSQPGL
jgi:hypothetical protein